MVVSIIIFIRTISRENKKDWESHNAAKDEIRASLMKLSMITDNINQTTSDIKDDMKSLSTSVNAMDGRLIKVEIEQATIWKRIDEMKEAINGKE